MQLHKQYKHMWFVFLMIFFIGGSSVVVAAVQNMQSDQHITTQSISCHDQHMMDQHHQMQALHVTSSDLGKCHDGMMQDDQHCQDCNSSSHCQAVNLALDQQPFHLSSSPSLELSAFIYSDYQARHLAGYWQEILRPPRT